MDILTAIMWMCPAAKWHLEGGTDYEHLVWDDVFFPKPTELLFVARGKTSRVL